MNDGPGLPDASGNDLLFGRSGHRLAWAAMPDAVRRAIEERCGAAVVSAVDQAGGFSPAVAARLRLEDGTRVFVKAIESAAFPDSVDHYRREGRIMAALPGVVPAPRLWWTDELDGWMVLVLDDVDGAGPQLPWRAAELDRVLAAVMLIGDVRAPDGVPALADDEQLGRCWADLRAERDRVARADDWVRVHLDDVADLERRWPEAVAGDALIHGDLRADNVVCTPDEVVFVDWPSAGRGVGWFDLVGMLPSVAMQGGGDPDELFRAHAGALADPDAVTVAVAAVAGFFVGESLRPAVPGLPSLRAFQAAQGREAVGWLRGRLEG